MKKKQYWVWGFVSAFIVLPLILIHSFDNVTLVRLILTTALLVFFPLLVLVMTLNPSEKPASQASNLKGRYSDKILKRWDIGVKFFAAAMSLLIFSYITFPVLKGVLILSLDSDSVRIVEGKIEDVDMGLFDPLGLINQSVKVEDQETGSYSIWYPDKRFRVGETYRLTILPETNIILDVKKIE